MSLLDFFDFKYPRTDNHVLNLDWCISAILEMQAAWADFSAGNKLVFADPLQHDLTKTYAKNTIVIGDNGNAYLSLQPVPKGVQLSDTDYWLMVFDFTDYSERANKNFTDNYFENTTRSPVSLSVGDWLVLNDVLYKVISAISPDDLFEVGVNIEHFTVEQFLKDFVTSVNQTLNNWYNQMTGTINQYKNDIDASELAYRQQLALDIANTTAALQAQLDAAISGATVDSEVINARVGVNNHIYSTLGDAIRGQITNDEALIIQLLQMFGKNNTDIAAPSITNKTLGLTGRVEDIGMSSFSVTSFTQVPEDGFAIYISGDILTNLYTSMLAFYSDNSNTAESVLSVVPFAGHDIIVPIPEGAKYFVLASDTSSDGLTVHTYDNAKIFYLDGLAKLMIDAYRKGTVTPNLADPSEFVSGHYKGLDGTTYDNVDYSYSGRILVEPGDVIRVNHKCVFITAYNGATASPSDGVQDFSGGDSYITYTVPAGINNIILSFLSAYGVDFIAYKYVGRDFPYVPYGEIYKISYEVTPQNNDRRASAIVKGTSLAANNRLYISNKSSSQKNTRLMFNAMWSTVGNFEMGFITAESWYGTVYNKLVLDSTKITVDLRYDYVNQVMISESVNHGLTLAPGILNIVWEISNNGDLKISIQNNTQYFEHIFEGGYVNNVSLLPYVYSSTSAFTDHVFSWTCCDLYKKIWLLGDSYMGYNPASWSYYLREAGYDVNVLINARPGQGSPDTITDFKTLLFHGRPEVAVYCIGMNDGNDSVSDPSAQWATGRDAFLEICSGNGIIPVFATIPTTSVVDNNQKNAWIRNSGYRYIDFAEGVGADGSGTWISGYLSGDNVHPTNAGARALYFKAITDMPELMVTE